MQSFVALRVDFVTAAKDFFAGKRTLIPELMRFHVACGLVGGKVFLAETVDHIPVGVAIWYGPGEEFMGERVCNHLLANEVTNLNT